ncbi:MAG: ABC transporter ATP-binding protein [Bacilli bacterium]|nr:ABC transporter ATP-binding protein [Bacilli bacterium]
MKETFKNLKKVFKKYGREYKGTLIKNSIFSLFGIFTNICIPIFSAKFIINFTDSKFEQAIYMSLIILVIYAVEIIKIMLIRRNNQILRRGIVKNIQMSLGREILRLEQTTLDSNSSGTFIQRLTGDTEKMSRIFTNGMVIIVKFLSTLGSFIAILIIDWHMFVFYACVSLILSVLNYIKNEKVGEKDREYRKESDKVAGLTGELVRGARDIKMLYAKESFMKNLDEKIVIQNEKHFEMRNVDMTYNLFIGYIKIFLEFIAVLLLILLINNNTLSIAVAIVLYNYRNTVLTNFMDIVSELLDECKNFNISSERVFAIANNKEFKKEVFGDKTLDSIKGDFEFKNVSFGYNENLILKNLSFKIKTGSTTGIVGKSGSGKTTIFNLLCKLYNINDGEILIDGINIEELNEEAIRGNITTISQNPYIFNMSIKDNLRLVKSNVSDEEIVEACKTACLDDFIESLPNKYDTIVGEAGINLSGGQRQRLAIARALIQNTKIILFDEATSALDNATQLKIQTAIDNLKGNYTLIIIAHRLSTIINCDKIFILEDGKISATGSHKELLRDNKYYKTLCEMELIKK